MSPKDPPNAKEERLARALRENLARRKALVRAKRARAGDDAATPAARRDSRPPRDEASS